MTDGQGELDRLLATSSVLLVLGPGGVGKTTIAAALGTRAVQVHGRRVLVVTIDPARRLADALGVGEVPPEPVLVPAGDGPGRLWASMIDMSRSWDRLVTDLASRADAEALLANPLYRSLTTRFIQSHDYIALDHLAPRTGDGGADDNDRWDLVLVDTPPASHAIDVLDAPQRMIDFFGSRLLRWLTAPYRSRLAQTTARPFLAVAERLLGGPFLARIAEFFWLFSKLQPGFVARAEAVTARLDDPSTGYVIVTTSDPASVAQTERLLDGLEARRHRASLVVHNRALPTTAVSPPARSSKARSSKDPSSKDPSSEGEPEGEAIADASLAAAVAALVGRDRHLVEALSARPSGSVAVHAVGWGVEEITSIDRLGRLLD